MPEEAVGRTGQPEADDDAALVRRVQDGDVAAYRELVRRHARPLHHYALRLTKNPSDAEDIVQETFSRLWSRAAEYSEAARPTTWLHRIVHNLAVDRLRLRGRWTSLEETSESVEDASPVDLLQEKRRAEALGLALSRLPERQAAAVTLVHLQELSGAEAASVLGVSAEALESLLARARRTLRALLGDPVDPASKER